jgi:hypothetical protein
MIHGSDFNVTHSFRPYLTPWKNAIAFAAIQVGSEGGAQQARGVGVRLYVVGSFYGSRERKRSLIPGGEPSVA